MSLFKLFRKIEKTQRIRRTFDCSVDSILGHYLSVARNERHSIATSEFREL
jgi:hypothetical protein